MEGFTKVMGAVRLMASYKLCNIRNRPRTGSNNVLIALPPTLCQETYTHLEGNLHVFGAVNDGFEDPRWHRYKLGGRNQDMGEYAE